MSERRLVIAGTASGVGKTTVTIGIMAALKKRGLVVQGFKCGPDYIDPTYHTAVTKRKSRNLDSWMFTKDRLLDIFTHGKVGADISIIEGVMGFFDGKSPESDVGSTAEISSMTKSPVLLVVDCASMARSAAAVVKGFQVFGEETYIAGVIANRVGSEGHYQLVKTAIEQECGIPVVGYVKSELDIEIPERQLGLVPSVERGDMDSFFDRLGDLLSETVDLDQLLKISIAEPLTYHGQSIFTEQKEKMVKIAVAKDEAFNFYYPENLELLEAKGVELVEFSPLANELLPKDVNGLYLGGGFPEEFAEKLAHNDATKQSIRAAIENGLPTLAECGGFMYLTESILTTDQKKHDMVGVIPGEVQMQTTLQSLGYREVKGLRGNFLLDHLVAKGHEFHYSTYHRVRVIPYAYEIEGIFGKKEEGTLVHQVVGGFTHIHFASCPSLVDRWIEKCIENN